MKDIKLITVDVWDTLVRRRCHPDAIKVHVSRFLLLKYYDLLKEEYKDVTRLLHARQAAEGSIGAAQKSAGFDDEYGLREVYATWLKSVLSITDDQDDILESLYRCELEQEYHVIYPDPTIETVLKKYGDVRRVFVSDFYMGAEELKVILKRLSLDQVIADGYSSCDLLLNKRSGRIFPYVLQREGLTASSVVHIGDNQHSDVGVPKGLGITALHYLPEEQDLLRQKLASEFSKPSLKVRALLAEVAEDSQSAEREGAVEKMYRSGIFNAPLLVGFVLKIMEELLKGQHDRVFFFTREGEFFKQIYDVVAAENPFGIPLPEAVILEVSRVATFSSSLEEVSVNSLMRIWSLYSTQSIGALFSSLDVDVAEFSETLSRHNLSAAEEIQYPWLDPRVQSLFEDASFIVAVDGLISKKREALKGYLRAKGFPVSGKAAIVDIGWRGTIQDNLAHIFPDLKIDGFYLGLDKFINPQPLNTKKFGYVADLNQSAHADAFVFNKVSPIEMLCNSPNGSVVGYQVADGAYSARRLIHDSENRSYHDAVVFFQQGVLRASSELGKAIRLHAISSDNLRELALSCWTGIISKPTPEIAAAYFKLAHNESFGLGRFDDKTSVIPTSIWIKSLFSIKAVKVLVVRLEQTGWPEGYLAQRRLGWIWGLITWARQIKRKQR